MQSSNSSGMRFHGSHKSSETKKSSTKPDTSGWSIEEMLESTVDKDGNPVPDPVYSVDGKRMMKGEHGKDVGDVAEAATADFD